MKILGYLNQNGYYPSALTTLIQTPADEHYLCYPNGERVNIIIEGDNEKLWSYLVQEQDSRIYEDGYYAYGINEENVLVGNHTHIIDQLQSMLEDGVLPKESALLVDEFIDRTRNISVSNFPAVPAQRLTIDAIRAGFDLIATFTIRTIKHSQSNSASRLLLQFRKNGSVRTAYKKNLSYKNKKRDITVPASMAAPFLYASTG